MTSEIMNGARSLVGANFHENQGLLSAPQQTFRALTQRTYLKWPGAVLIRWSAVSFVSLDKAASYDVF